MATAPLSPPPTPTSASPTPQPTALRVLSTRCRLHTTAAAPPSPPPTPTSAFPTRQPTALRVSQHAAAASTAQPLHLLARHRHPHPPPSLISHPPSVLLNTLPPPPHRSRRNSQLPTDTHIRLLHSSVNRPPCFSSPSRRLRSRAAAPLSPPPTPTSASPTPQPTALHSRAAAPLSRPPSVLVNTLPPPPHRCLHAGRRGAGGAPGGQLCGRALRRAGPHGSFYPRSHCRQPHRTRRSGREGCGRARGEDKRGGGGAVLGCWIREAGLPVVGGR